MSSMHLKNYTIRAFLLLAVVSVGWLGVIPKDASATTKACWFDPRALKVKRSLSIPKGRVDDFIDYVKMDLPNDTLRLSTVESDDSITLILKNVDAGILVIYFDHAKGTQIFKVAVKVCDYRKDWRPHWAYVRGKMDAFLKQGSSGAN